MLCAPATFTPLEFRERDVPLPSQKWVGRDRISQLTRWITPKSPILSRDLFPTVALIGSHPTGKSASRTRAKASRLPSDEHAEACCPWTWGAIFSSWLIDLGNMWPFHVWQSGVAILAKGGTLYPPPIGFYSHGVTLQRHHQMWARSRWNFLSAIQDFLASHFLQQPTNLHGTLFLGIGNWRMAHSREREGSAINWNCQCSQNPTLWLCHRANLASQISPSPVSLDCMKHTFMQTSLPFLSLASSFTRPVGTQWCMCSQCHHRHTWKPTRHTQSLSLLWIIQWHQHTLKLGGTMRARYPQMPQQMVSIWVKFKIAASCFLGHSSCVFSGVFKFSLLLMALEGLRP